VLSPTVGLLAVGAFFFCLACAILLGYQSRRATLANRADNARTGMLVLMAGMLKDESEATLQRIAEKGGPAGEAASLLLEQRKCATTSISPVR
jgi:hypothetical protein